MEKKLILTKSEQRIYDYIKKHGGITTLDAIMDLGETRLSARIFELKESGVNIQDEWIEVKNRWGEKRHVKSYFIGKGVNHA